MEKILLLSCLIVMSCAHHKKTMQRPADDEVSLAAALNQAQASYLKGCVDAHQKLKHSPSFPQCVQEARKHRDELDSIMEQEL